MEASNNDWIPIQPIHNNTIRILENELKYCTTSSISSSTSRTSMYMKPLPRTTSYSTLNSSHIYSTRTVVDNFLQQQHQGDSSSNSSRYRDISNSNSSQQQHDTEHIQQTHTSMHSRPQVSHGSMLGYHNSSTTTSTCDTSIDDNETLKPFKRIRPNL